MVVLVAGGEGLSGVKRIAVIGDDRQSFFLFEFQLFKPALRAGTIRSGSAREDLADHHLLTGGEGARRRANDKKERENSDS